MADNRPPNNEEEDFEFEPTEGDPHLAGCDSVLAQCLKVEKPRQFNAFGQPRTRLIFHFNVIEPNQYAGTRLKMFAEFKLTWRFIPRSAKIRKLVELAGGRHAIGIKVRFNSLFQYKIFRCKLSHGRSTKRNPNPTPCTVIETLIEKVQG